MRKRQQNYDQWRLLKSNPWLFRGKFEAVPAFWQDNAGEKVRARRGTQSPENTSLSRNFVFACPFPDASNTVCSGILTRFHYMSQNIDAILWTADADSLRFDLVEGNVGKILGYTAEEWLSEDGFWQARLHPDDAEEIVSTCVELSRQRKPHRLTYRMIAADGRVVWLQDNVDVKVEGTKATLSGVMIDVTHLVQQRQRLEEASLKNAHFRKLYDLVHVAIWEEDWTGVLAELRNMKRQGITDIREHARQTPGFADSMLAGLRVMAVNPAAVEMFGASSSEELIRRATEVFDADRPHSVFVTALHAIMHGERRIEGVTTLRRLSGEQVHVKYRIALPGLDDRDAHVVICEMDIGEIQKAKERLELVIRATSDVIWDFDLVRDTLWTSEGLKRQFGLDPAEMYSGLEKWTARIHPDDIGGVMRQFNAIVNEASDLWEQEYRFQNGEGVYRWVRDEGFILRDANDIAVRMVGSLVDITEQRELEERLRQSQKLEAIGKLTGGMAHDFNNLLTIVLGSLEGLEDHIGDNASARRLLDTATHAVDRSARLISQLLSYARQRPMALQSVDMAQMVACMIQVVSRTLGEQIKVSVVQDPGLWNCRADPGQFESALLNLCLNARDAMRDGGELTIGMHNADVGAKHPLVSKGLAKGKYVVLSVADSGHGMDEATLHSAFDPFFTTKEVGAGSGLGLSMVLGFAQQSRGTAQILSEPGRGTAVELYLPAVAVVETAEEKPSPLDCDQHRGAGHILVVEDQDMVRDHVANLLSHLGYTVTTSGTAAEAINLFNSETHIDLVLTDIVLPGGVSGLDLAETFSELRPDIPVAFMSGYSETSSDTPSPLLEGRNFLRKPFRRADLGNLLQRLLATGESSPRLKQSDSK